MTILPGSQDEKDVAITTTANAAYELPPPVATPTPVNVGGAVYEPIPGDK